MPSANNTTLNQFHPMQQMACTLTKLQSRLTMASLPSTTLRQSSSSQKNLFSCHRQSIGPKLGFFAAASNPRTLFHCLKPPYLPLPVNRLQISQNRLVFLASSPDVPKGEINPNPSYPTPGEPDAPKPEINPDPCYPTPGKPPLPPESPEPLSPEVPAKPEIPPSPDPSWPSEVPHVDRSPRPEISSPDSGNTYPIKPPTEVPLRIIGIRDPPLNPPGSPPPDIIPPLTPSGLPPDIPPNVPPIPPLDVPPIPSPDWPPFPCPPPPDPFSPIPTPPIMRDWLLQVPWIPILNITAFQ